MKFTKENLNDKLWRLNNLYKVVTKDKQIVTFKPNRAQLDFHVKKHTKNIVLKSRRLGFTTYFCIDGLDDVLWTPNFKSIILSYDQESVLELFDDKISFPWDKYPNQFKGLYALDTDTTNKLKFGFGDNTYSSISVKRRARSGSNNKIHVSEFGKICKQSPRDAKEIISGTFPTVPIGGEINIESTAEGEFGYFYDMFWEAWNRGEPRNDNEFKAHFYSWRWDDWEMDKITTPIAVEEMEQSDAFAKYQVKHNLSAKEITYYYLQWLGLKKDWDLLHQEYPTTPEEAFIASGRKMFSFEIVDQHEKRYGREPIEIVGNWKFYEEYRTGHFYAMGADPSEGVGRDNATIVIWDFTYRPKVVAVYAYNKIEPDKFAYELRFGGRRYGECLIAVERNNHGHTTLATLKGIYDPHMIYKEVRKDEEDDKETMKLGWPTNLVTKPKVLYDLVTAMNEEFIEIPDKSLLHEMKTYDQDDLNKMNYDNDEVRHWDRIMAAAIGFQMKSQLDLNTTGAIITEHRNTQHNIHSGI